MFILIFLISILVVLFGISLSSHFTGETLQAYSMLTFIVLGGAIIYYAQQYINTNYIEKNKDLSRITQILGIIFVCSIGLLASPHVIGYYINNSLHSLSLVHTYFLDIVDHMQIYITLLGSISGVLLIHLHKQYLARDISKQTTAYKRKITYILICILILLIGLYLRIPKGTAIQTFHDIYAGLGILEHALPQMDSGVVYRRAFPFSYILAAFIRLQKSTGIDPAIILKMPVFLFSLLSLLVRYKILRLLELKKEHTLYILLLLSISSRIVTYAGYLRFFSMLDFFIYLGIYGILLYSKTEQKKHLVYFIVACFVGLFIEKTALLLLGIFVLFSIYDALTYKNYKKIALHMAVIVGLGASFLVSYNISSLSFPEMFSEHKEIVQDAKANIFYTMRFDDYFIRLVNNRYPYIIMCMIIYLYLLISIKQKKYIYHILLCVVAFSILPLSFLGTSKGVPRIISYYGYIFVFIIGFVMIHMNTIFRNHRYLQVFLNISILLSLTTGGHLFTTGQDSGSYITAGPTRISNAKTFIYMHDLSLTSGFVKQYLESRRHNMLILSTHSAARENYYLQPYAVDYILNDVTPEKRFTTAYNKFDNKLYSLYRGIPIIGLQEILQLNLTHDILIITNYDFEYRVSDKIQEFIQTGEAQLMYTSDQDDRAKVYLLEKGSL